VLVAISGPISVASITPEPGLTPYHLDRPLAEVEVPNLAKGSVKSLPPALRQLADHNPRGGGEGNQLPPRRKRKAIKLGPDYVQEPVFRSPGKPKSNHNKPQPAAAEEDGPQPATPVLLATAKKTPVTTFSYAFEVRLALHSLLLPTGDLFSELYSVICFLSKNKPSLHRQYRKDTTVYSTSRLTSC
jgi:hypothetical protein